MKEEIEKRQYFRFLVLNELYKVSKGKTTQKFNLTLLAANVGVKNGMFDEVAGYLTDEKLLASVVGPGSYQSSITHKGKKAVEFAHRFPEEQSEYFPSLNDMGV